MVKYATILEQAGILRMIRVIQQQIIHNYIISELYLHILAFSEFFFAFLIGEGVQNDLIVAFAKVVAADIDLSEGIWHLHVEANLPHCHCRE